MFERLKTIRQLKRLRKKPVDKEFLRMLRSDLERVVDENPAPEHLSMSKWSFADLVRARVVQVPLAAFALLVLTSAGLAGASQRSLPGERLFAVKTFTEDIRSTFTLSSESRAELQARFAAERINEIKDILEQKGVEAPGLDVALSRLEDNSKRAEEIIAKEKEKGGSLQIELRKRVWEDFEGGAKNIKSALDAKKNELARQEDELRQKIKQAEEAANSEQTTQLRSNMDDVNKRQEQLKTEKEKIKAALEQSQQRLKLEIKIEFDDDEDEDRRGSDGGEEQENRQEQNNGSGGSKEQLQKSAPKQSGQNSQQGQGTNTNNSGTGGQTPQQNDEQEQSGQDNRQTQERKEGENNDNDNDGDNGDGSGRDGGEDD